MSPSSQGVVPGLFLALVAALAVLAANNHWLFPALDETGVRYLMSADALAEGRSVRLPLASWDAAEPDTGLEGRGTLVPIAMGGLIRLGARSHVAALWMMAASAGAAVFFLSWAVGGAAGAFGAMAAGLLVLSAPLTLDALTTAGPDLTLTAMVMLLLGTMTYLPRASGLHGVVAALAWLAHPAGIGAVAGAALWPVLRWRTPQERLVLAGAALAPPLVLLVGGLLRPLLAPAVPAATSFWIPLGGALRWAATGVPGFVAETAGGALLVGLTLLTAREWETTPRPPVTVHWSDPVAYDLLASTFRTVVALLVPCTLVGAAFGTPSELALPWLPATFLLAGLAAATVARWGLRHRRPHQGTPAVVLVVWILLSAWGSWSRLGDLREHGKGVTADVWVESEVLRWIDNRSRDVPRIYASDPALVLLQSGRGSRSVPVSQHDMDAFAVLFRRHPGAIVLTGAGAGEAASALRRRIRLEPVVSVPEGIVLLPAG